MVHALVNSAFASAARCTGISDLPAALGLLYFLNSCTQSFPLTANTGFLNVELKMPQSIRLGCASPPTAHGVAGGAQSRLREAQCGGH